MFPDLPELETVPLEDITKDALTSLSTDPIYGIFQIPYDRTKEPLLDHARGGLDILDASKGLNIQNWKLELIENKIFITGDKVIRKEIQHNFGTIKWISFCFDQNMHYNLAYVLENGDAKLYWYDAVTEEYTIKNLGKVKTPFIRMDDVRKPFNSVCNIILSYIKNGDLCICVQKDRFMVEYVLKKKIASSIKQCGMSKKMRFQWVLE